MTRLVLDLRTLRDSVRRKTCSATAKAVIRAPRADRAPPTTSRRYGGGGRRGRARLRAAHPCHRPPRWSRGRRGRPPSPRALVHRSSESRLGRAHRAGVADPGRHRTAARAQPPRGDPGRAPGPARTGPAHLRPGAPHAQPAAAGLALTQLSYQISLVGGSAVAGLLASVGGLRLCYLVDMVSFLAHLYAVAPAVAAPVLAMPFAILPAVNAAYFAAPAPWGCSAPAPAVGGVVALVLSGGASHATRPGRAMLVAGAIWGLALAVFGVAPSLWLALVALALAGWRRHAQRRHARWDGPAGHPGRLRGAGSLPSNTSSVSAVRGSATPGAGSSPGGPPRRSAA